MQMRSSWIVAAVLLGCAGPLPVHAKDSSPEETDARAPGAHIPAAQEWWRTAEVDGKQLPVLTEPWFDTLRGAKAGHYDKATDILWTEPDRTKISLPVALSTAQNYCQRLGNRLPTRHEMDSIQDVRRVAPTIDLAVMTGAVSAPYWTMTPARHEGTSNWVVNLSDGRAYEVSVAKSLANFFCVFDFRGSPPAVHYVDQHLTVIDNATGLVWQKDTLTALDYHALADKCVGSTVSGKKWRVPTWKELSSLLSTAYKAPYLDPLFRGETALTSSTPAVERGLKFRYVNFQTGTSGAEMLSATRCVEQALPNSVTSGRTFKGNVSINGPDPILGAHALQQLEAGMYAVIDGNLEITGVSSASVILPYLRKVTGNIVLNNTKASWLSFPALETVGGSVEIADNAKLLALWMPSLTAADGSLAITRNPQLGASQPAGDAEHVISVDLPALQRIGGDFSLEFNTQLKSLTLYKLQEVGRGLRIVSNTAMWQIVMTSLGSVGLACRNHDDFCGDLSIQNNSRLVGLFLPALATLQYDFRVSGNSALVTLQERIKSVSGLYAQDNKSLCERMTLDPILSRMWKLGRFPDKVSIQRNSNQDGCATRCPNESAGVCHILEDKTSHRSSTETRQPGNGVL